MKRLAAKVLSSNWCRTTWEVRNMRSAICWLTGKPEVIPSKVADDPGVDRDKGVYED